MISKQENLKRVEHGNSATEAQSWYSGLEILSHATDEVFKASKL